MGNNRIAQLITGSLIGITVGVYAFSHMNNRKQNKIIKKGRKMFNMATGLLS